MTLFHSPSHRLRGNISPTDLSQQMSIRRLRILAHRAVSRTIHALKLVHAAIVTAKTRRVQRELMLHKFPQRPLILDDKWDF